MPWYKVTMSKQDVAQDKHLDVENAFASLFLAAGAPVDAGMFGNIDVADEYVYLFSPAASTFFSAMLASHNAVECLAPARKSVTLLLGHDGALPPQ
jgi:hypothetical protein